MPDARRAARHATIRWALAPLLAALATAAACAPPPPTPAPTPPPTRPAAVAPTSTPGTAAALSTVQPSAVVHLKAADEFEQLKGRGQPVLLAVLDEGYG